MTRPNCNASVPIMNCEGVGCWEGYPWSACAGICGMALVWRRVPNAPDKGIHRQQTPSRLRLNSGTLRPALLTRLATTFPFVLYFFSLHAAKWPRTSFELKSSPLPRPSPQHHPRNTARREHVSTPPSVTHSGELIEYSCWWGASNDRAGILPK